MNNDPLTHEIVKRIIINIGTDSVLYKHPTHIISGKYDDGKDFTFPISTKSLKIDNDTLRCCYVSLNDDTIVVFQFGNSFIFGLVMSDVGSFYQCEHDDWKPVSMITKAKILASYEIIVSYGLPWQRHEEMEDLIKKLVTLSDLFCNE